MNRLATTLALVLAAQLLLTAAFFWPRENPGESEARTALLQLSPADIDRIVVSSATDSLLLMQQGEDWIMPDYHRLPVQQGRLERVREELPGLARGWPVASSDAAVERFQVAPGNYQRKIEFFAGENSAGELFIGTSPGFRKVHIRPVGEEAVYAVEFNAFELPAAAGEWLEKTLLGLEGASAIQGLDYNISLSGETWMDESGQQADPATVDNLLNGLASLRITGAADIATASILSDVAAPPTLTVTAAGSSYEFRLYEIEGAYYIQRSDIPVYFSLGQFDYDRLNGVNADALFAPAAETEPQADAAASPQDAG